MTLSLSFSLNTCPQTHSMCLRHHCTLVAWITLVEMNDSPSCSAALIKAAASQSQTKQRAASTASTPLGRQQGSYNYTSSYSTHNGWAPEPINILKRHLILTTRNDSHNLMLESNMVPWGSDLLSSVQPPTPQGLQHFNSRQIPQAENAL